MLKYKGDSTEERKVLGTGSGAGLCSGCFHKLGTKQDRGNGRLYENAGFLKVAGFLYR